MIISLISYILMGIGLYTIAENRGIDHPWLAWIPIGNLWLLGCISDHYRYVTRGEEKKRRRTLLIFVAVEAALTCVALYMGLSAVIIGLVGESSWDTASVVISVILLVVHIASFVVLQVATYDLHKSCNPDNAVLFLIIGMLVPVTQSLFILLNRDKEQGMPPRKR